MWSNFFIGAASASAALAGLVFVALSVNINQIIQFSHLPIRAAATLGVLILVLVCSMAILLPQPMASLGGEVLGFSALAWFLKVWAAVRSFQSRRHSLRPMYEAMIEGLFGQLQTVPFAVAGILFLGGNAAGYYWTAGGVLAVFVCSVFSSWVLLVEILR